MAVTSFTDNKGSTDLKIRSTMGPVGGLPLVTGINSHAAETRDFMDNVKAEGSSSVKGVVMEELEALSHVR